MPNFLLMVNLQKGTTLTASKSNSDPNGDGTFIIFSGRPPLINRLGPKLEQIQLIQFRN